MRKTTILSIIMTLMLCISAQAQGDAIVNTPNIINSFIEVHDKSEVNNISIDHSSASEEINNPILYDSKTNRYFIYDGKQWTPLIQAPNVIDTNSEDLIHLNNGNVRIGVGTAEQKLHVFGNTKISDSGNSDGKLFIGTSPSEETQAGDYNLLVGGKGIMSELKINLPNSWPDYVFDERYELMPLNELENYIHDNKHLPGVPSADQVEKENGFQVGAMQKVLLEKIEELTLYMIDLKKENENLKSQMNEIKVKIKSSDDK